jgi:hypothetical protein
MLSPAAKQRYARHLLLAEVGEPGQERLCDAQACLPVDSDPRASRVARDYLERAGLSVRSRERDASRLQLNRDAIHALAGDPRLEPAAAALLGALAAVEAIKSELGLGVAFELPAGLQLCAERAR